MVGGPAMLPKSCRSSAALLLFAGSLAGAAAARVQGPAEARSPAQEYEFPPTKRIVAIGDVHGAHDTFVEILRSTGLVGDDLQWTGGATHLVQTGDVVARGPSSRKAMDLLMALEPQAEAAGGRVHALIGNHEFWYAAGNLDFVSDGELEAFYGARDDELREQASAAGDGEFRRGELALREAFGPDGTYGKWIRGHNAAIRVGDYVFVHGGVTAQGAELGLGALNARVREEMDLEGWATSFSTSEEGPLFTRRYSTDDLLPDDEREAERELGFVLDSLGARVMVMGHTVTYGVIEPRFDGRAILIDSGMLELYEGGRAAALVIEGEETIAVYRRGTVPLPDSLEGDEGERYVQAVVAASPGDAALTHWQAVTACRTGRFAAGTKLHEASGVLDREVRVPFAWRRDAAECFGSAGEADKASELLDLYLRGLRRRAEATSSWNHWNRYARECLRLGRNLDAAFNVAAELAAALPSSGEAKLTLAWAYIEKGDPRRALRVLKAAERLGAANSFEVLVLAGRAHAAQGHSEEALESFRQAETLQPGDPEVQEAIAKLSAELK